MRQAFGVPLARNTGIDDYDTRCKIVSTRCSYYDLPGGAVGREFIDILTQEVSMLYVLNNSRSHFIPHPMNTISFHLMLKGHVRAAVRWLTERADKGGVLDISTYTNDGPKTVLDVLKEKHPDPAQSSAEVFLSCSELSPLIDVDITGSHVEKVARQIQGSAGPGGSTVSHWQGFLLCYGPHSAKLRDAVAELARHLANSIVECKEGVGQGDPLSMLMYASALMPLIKSLSNPTTWIQNWYADDSSCTAKLTDLCVWFDKLCDLGPKYDHEAEAKSMFQHLGIKVMNGYRFLGGFIGDRESTKQFLDNKITGWVNNLLKLSKAAESQPQAAFAALSKSMQFEWSYMQRILPSYEEAFTPIWNTLYQYFWPAIFEEFRDALALRYNRPLLKMPANCDECGAATSLEHALDCKKGGLVTQRHSEVRDVIGDLASVVFKEVVKESVVQEANEAEGVPSLIADLSIRGVWQSQTVALFDVHVTDTDAPSHSQRVVSAILSSAEEAKKKKYSEAAALRRASFTPFVVSVDGVWVEKQTFLSNILLRNLLVRTWRSNS
eukprot:Em0016g630a